MKLVGFSLDNLSLMALTISTGFVVDDAIVMIENIVRFIEPGTRRWSRAQGRQANRFHRHFAEHLADRRLHSPAVYDRHRRPSLPEFAITLSVAVAVPPLSR